MTVVRVFHRHQALPPIEVCCFCLCAVEPHMPGPHMAGESMTPPASMLPLLSLVLLPVLPGRACHAQLPPNGRAPTAALSPVAHLLLLTTGLLQHVHAAAPAEPPQCCCWGGHCAHLCPASTMRRARNWPNVPKPTMPIFSCLSFDSLFCILCSKSNGCAASRANTLTEGPPADITRNNNKGKKTADRQTDRQKTDTHTMHGVWVHKRSKCRAQQQQQQRHHYHHCEPLCQQRGTWQLWRAASPRPPRMPQHVHASCSTQGNNWRHSCWYGSQPPSTAL